MILHLHKSQLWLHILSTWRTKQDDSSFDGFDWQLSQSAELFITFYSHTGKKNKNKEWAFKICSCFSFSDVCGIGSAQISSFWPVNQTHRQQRPSRAADWKEETVKEKKHQCAAEVSAVIADLGWTEREKNTLTFRVVLTQMGEYSYSAQTPTHTPHTHTHTHTHTHLSLSFRQPKSRCLFLLNLYYIQVRARAHTHSQLGARTPPRSECSVEGVGCFFRLHLSAKMMDGGYKTHLCRPFKQKWTQTLKEKIDR